MRFNIPEELFVGYEPEPSAEPEPAAPPAPDPEAEFADAGRRYGQLVSSLAHAGSRLGTLEDSFQGDPDHLTIPDRFREGADSLRDEYASRFDHGPTRDIFLRDFDRLAAPKRDRVEKGAFGRALQERLGGLRTEALRAGDDEEAQNHALRQAASEFRRAQHFGHVADAGTAMRAFLDDIAEARRAAASPVPAVASPDGVMPSEAANGPPGGGSVAMEPGSADDMAEATQDATAPDNSDSAADMAGHLLPPGQLPEAQDAFDRSGRTNVAPANVAQVTSMAPTKAKGIQPPAPPPEKSPRSYGERARMVDELFAIEGGIANNPNDRRGETHYGVTDAILSDYKQRARTGDPIASKTISQISRDDARTMFDEMIRNYRLDHIEDPHIRQQIFDMAANHGPGVAIRILQETLRNLGYDLGKDFDGGHGDGSNDGVDGILGPKTRQVLNGLSDTERLRVNNLVTDRRRQLYQAIVMADPSQNNFLNGWLDRAEHFRLP